MVDNLNQVVMNLEEEVVRKKNKYAAKKKAQLENLYTPIQVSATRFVVFMSSRLMPASATRFATFLLSCP